MPLTEILLAKLLLVASSYRVWLVLGGLVALKGWLWEYSRGRGRCRRCGYSLDGRGSLTCPECGKVHKSTSDLFGVRHHKVVLAIGIGLLMWSGYAFMGVRRDSMLWPLCVRSLLALGATYRGTGLLDREMYQRVQSEAVRDDEFVLIMRRECPYDERSICDALQLRKKWPQGAPFGIWLRPPGAEEYPFTWNGPNFDLTVSDTTGGPAATSVVIERLGGIYPAHALGCALTNEGRYQFRLSVSRYYGQRAIPLFDVEVAGLVEIVPDVRDMIKLDADEGLTAQVRRAFSKQLWIYMGEDGNHGVGFDAQALSHMPAGEQVAVRIHVCRGDRVVAEAEYVNNSLRVINGFVTCRLAERDPILRQFDPLDGAWTVRIVGDPILALRDPAATSAWDGQFEVPPAAIKVSTVAPPVPDAR